MKIAKAPQTWAGLVMTEAIEYIFPLEKMVENDEEILIYT